MRKRSSKKGLNIALIGGAALGGVAAGMVVTKVLPQIGLPEDIAPYIPLALGAFLTMQKDPLMQAAGVGMIGAGAPTALNKLGVNINMPAGMLPMGADYTAPDQFNPVVMNGIPTLVDSYGNTNELGIGG